MSTTPQAAPTTTPAAPVTASTTAPPGVEQTSAEEEGRFHNYVGHDIPWYVRLAWILFWVLSAWYVIRLLLPALDTELLSPP
ncbi:MAG: hypothetical protein U0835_03945 [Isosphaeraceae bacterium]